MHDVSDLHLLILFYISRIFLGFHVTFKFYNFQICFRSNALRTPWDHSTIIFVSSGRFCLVWPCILGDFEILPNSQHLYLILLSSLLPNCPCYLCPDSSSYFVQFWPSFSVSKSMYSITSCYFFLALLLAHLTQIIQVIPTLSFLKTAGNIYQALRSVYKLSI